MSKPAYTQMQSDEWDGEDASEWSRLPSQYPYLDSLRATWVRYILCFIAGILCTVGFTKVLEAYSKNNIAFLNTSGNTVSLIAYNDTFPGPPTPESELQWLEMMPNGLGFVQHEQFGDGIVAFTVFHQLHCLMALRHSIYDSWNGTAHVHVTPHHTKHCLEYIRQTIMCSADTNVEQRIFFESEPHQNQGWGLHHCRGYGKIKDFAEEWRVWDGKTPADKRPIEDPEVLKGRVIYY